MNKTEKKVFESWLILYGALILSPEWDSLSGRFRKKATTTMIQTQKLLAAQGEKEPK